MTDRRALAAIVCLLIGACSRPAPDAAGNAQGSPSPAATAAAAAAAPGAKPAGCSDKIQIVLDRASFIDVGDKPFPAARLAAFEPRAAAAFHRAANGDCRTAAVRKALAPIRRVIVQSGAGAAESTFYGEDGRKPDELVFQWAFNEADLGVPKQEDIELGLRCWADGARAECANKGD